MGNETSLPQWAQAELDSLRKQIITLQRSAAAAVGAHVITLREDWFVMPGPKPDQPTIRLWLLSEDGPKQIGVLNQGQSLAMQHAPSETGEG